MAAGRLRVYVEPMGLLDQLRRWVPLGDVPEIGSHDLAARLEGEGAPPVLIDVRTAAEHARSRIPGARSVPIHTLAGWIDSLELASGVDVVAICLSAHRSIPAVRLLRERGFEAVQLEGGMRAWWAAGLPTERD